MHLFVCEWIVCVLDLYIRIVNIWIFTSPCPKQTINTTCWTAAESPKPRYQKHSLLLSSINTWWFFKQEIGGSFLKATLFFFCFFLRFFFLALHYSILLRAILLFQNLTVPYKVIYNQEFAFENSLDYAHNHWKETEREEREGIAYLTHKPSLQKLNEKSHFIMKNESCSRLLFSHFQIISSVFSLLNIRLFG